MPSHAVPRTPLSRRLWRAVVALALSIGCVASAVAFAFGGTPGSSSGNGTYVGGVVFDGPEPLVLWKLPGTNGKVGTCIDANVNGPLTGPYKRAKTINDPVYAELEYLYGRSTTSDKRLAELSALISHKYDEVNKDEQWRYVRRGQSVLSKSDANAMLAEAKKLAGPYQVRISWPTADTKVGVPYTATITVTSVAGAGVPALPVTLTGTGVNLSSPSVTTNTSGSASVGFTIKEGTSATVSIGAAVSSHTSLDVYTSSGEQTMMTGGSASVQRGSHTTSVTRTRDVHLVKVAVGDPAKTPVPGYTFRITDSAGKTVLPTVTTGTARAPADLGRLTVGASYTATEIGAPPGGALYIPTKRSTTFTVPAGTGPATVTFADPTKPRPSVSTQVANESVIVGQSLSDHVTVGGDDDESGTITAHLYGPVDVPPSGHCSDLTLEQYAHAPSIAVSVPISGNGKYTVDGPAANRAGCYGWAETLTLRPSGVTATSPPTAPHEATLVTAPTVVTQASHGVAAPGAELSDSVSVTGLGNHHAKLTATLYGPLPADTHGCARYNEAAWRAAIGADRTKHVAGSAGLAVTGDGTSRTQPIVVRTPGCYTFYEELTPLSTPARTVRTALGIRAESTIVRPPAVPALIRPHAPHAPLANTGAPVARLLSGGVGLIGIGGMFWALASLLSVRRRAVA